jgi:hypothetical protein
LLVTGTIVSPWPQQLEARRVEHAGHADDLLARKARDALELVHHGVERVRHDDDERVGRRLLEVLADAADDLEVDAQQIVARHAGLARHARRDDDDVRPGDVGPVGRARDLRVVAEHGAVLLEVEGLALGEALLLGDVEEDDVAELLARDEGGELAADVAGTDERDFFARRRHCGGSFLLTRT